MQNNRDYNYNSDACCSATIRSMLKDRFNRREPKAFIRTFGCQGNVSDSEIIKGILVDIGFQMTALIEEADFVLLNTCAIREHAQDRAFGNIGALKKYKESKPSLIIALCGCMMQQDYVVEKIRNSYSFIDMVFGTNSIHKLPELILRRFNGEKHLFDLTVTESTLNEGLPVERDSSFKAWVPIMYGCDNYCSYCIVPYVRGRERSRNPEIVIAEIENLISCGYKEITLLGQNVNSYGNNADFNMNFSMLLKSINSISGEFIIRFMTSNPKDCNHNLLDTIAECEKVAKHLHLPFQSGNNRVLKAMNRGYTREKYLDLLDYARKVMPDLSVTSDVIVGFPGETYEEFKDTLSLVDYVKFTSLFTFIFSPRKGTAAVELPDIINREQKVEWFQELTKVQEAVAAKRSNGMDGKIFRVLCETETTPDSGIVSGRTEGNIIIEFPAPPELIGTFQLVRVNEVLTWMVKGKLINC